MRGLFLTFLLLFASTNTYGWTYPSQDHCSSDTEISYFLDSDAKVNLSDALSFLRKKPSQKSPQTLHYGYTNGTVWLYLKVRQNPEWLRCILELANPQLDYITIFHIENDIPKQVAQLGDTLPFANRFYRTRHYVFPFRSEYTQEFLISIRSAATMTIPLRVLSRDQYVNDVSLDYLLLGLFYGIMAFFIFFGIHSFISFREKAYFLYAVFALSMLLFFMDRDGIAYQFFWSSAIYWKSMSVRVLAAISMAFGVLYYLHILPIRSVAAKSLGYLYVFASLGLAVALLVLDPALTNHATIIMGLGTPVLMISLPIFAIKEDRTFAPYLLAAGSVSLLGLLIYSASVTGLIPYNAVSENAMKFSTLFEFLLLAFGIHHKIRDFHRSRLEAKLKLAELEKKSAVYKAVFDTANMLAHDVRRPLDKVLKFLRRVQRVDAEKLVAYVDNAAASISEDVKTAESMLSDLLEIGKARDLSAETNLSKLVPVVANGKFEVSMNYVGSVRGDTFQLKRVFDNLVKNALQATNGSKTSRYWIHTKDCGDHAGIIVGNTGSSIGRHDLSEIFKPFVSKGKKNGSGLGLAIVDKFVHTYGGDVWAESNGFNSNGEAILKKYDSDYVEFHITLPKGSGYVQKTSYSSD